MSTPQEFLLHKGAQSREQQRRSFGIKQSPNFKLGGNNNSNSNTNFRSANSRSNLQHKIHYNSQPPGFSDWDRASSTTPPPISKRDDSFSQSISSSSTTISSIGLPPEELLRDMALSAVQTVTNGVNEQERTADTPNGDIGNDNSRRNYSYNNNNTKNKSHLVATSGGDRRSISYNHRGRVNNNRPNVSSKTSSIKELISEAEDIAERFRSGVSTYGNRRSFSGTRFDALMRTSVYEGMEIDIPSYTTTDRGGSKHSLYTIKIKLATGHQWRVERRYKQMNTLHHVIKNTFNIDYKTILPSFPGKRYVASSLSSSFVEERRVKLEAYLKALVKLPQVWKIEELAHFLDDASKSMSLRLHYTYLLHDNDNFDKLCSASGNILRDCIQKIRSQDQLIEKLKIRCQNQEEKLKDVQGSLQRYKIESQLGIAANTQQNFGNHRNSNNIDNNRNNNGGSNPVPIPFNVFDHNGSTSNKLNNNSTTGEEKEFAKISPFISTPVIERNLMNLVSSPMPSIIDNHIAINNNNNNNDKNNSDDNNGKQNQYENKNNYNSFNVMETSQGGTTGLIDDPWSSSSSFTTMVHNNTNNGTQLPLPLNQISFHIEKHSTDDYVDNILNLISPSLNDLKIQKYVSNKLFSMFTEDLAVAHICNIENTALGTFLPNEPISISVFLFSNEDESKLLDVQRTLCNYILLNTTSSHNFMTATSSTITDGKNGIEESEIISIKRDNMKVTHVSTTRTTDNDLKLKCTIDGKDVVIKKNSLSGLYLSAMVEEADQIIGKNHLVKRGLILIRSWCKLECQGYWSGFDLALSDDSIFVVILYIFNMYHARLHFPLQVLVTFLSVMSSFTWGEHALTIHGPMEIHGQNYGNIVKLSDEGTINSNDTVVEPIFSEKFAQRYRSNYEDCMKFKDDQDVIGRSKSRSSSSISENDEDNNNNSNNNNNNSTVTRSTTPPQEERIKLTEINIINPLKRSENVASYLNKDGAMKLYSAFCQGARGFNQLMKSIRQEYDDMYHRTWPSSRNNNNGNNSNHFISNNGRGLKERVESCFPNILKHCSNRTEKQNSHINFQTQSGKAENTTNKSFASSNVCKDGDTVLLLYTDGFSGSQLMKVTKNILLEKGPLPVGEIGKLLKEKLPNSHLSNILKEKFGGLKKFIEQFYGDEFLLGTNHKFNPKVYLRKVLTPEEIDLIKNGTDISKKNKSKKSRRNKKKDKNTSNTTPKSANKRTNSE